MLFAGVTSETKRTTKSDVMMDSTTGKDTGEATEGKIPQLLVDFTSRNERKGSPPGKTIFDSGT